MRRSGTLPKSKWHHCKSFVALYRAIPLRFGYGLVSCYANGPRDVKKHKPHSTKAAFFPPLLPVGSQESVLKVPKRGQFHAAIRVQTNVAIRVHKVTRETDGIAAKLLRCGIASEGRKRNLKCKSESTKGGDCSEKWSSEKIFLEGACCPLPT